MPEHVPEGPARVFPMIGRKAKFPAVDHRAGKLVQSRRLDEPSLVMTPFRPRIGKKKKHAGKRPIGDRPQDGACVLHGEAHREIGSLAQRAQRRCDSIDVGLATDQANSWIGLGLRQEMFATAKTDFEPNRRHGGRKQDGRIEGHAGRRQDHVTPRQFLREKLALKRA